ncbi:MAG: NFACT family protein [Bacilli bacterium]|nr:NFACT family protein [Bacilli bacterium]
MRISHKSYTTYINNLVSNIKGNNLFSPILLNNETILFPFQNETGKYLVISLNHQTPLLYLTNDNSFYSSFENNYLVKVKKFLQKPTIKSIELLKSDLIVKIHIVVQEELNENEYIIFAELIPTKPNLIIVDSNNFIIESYYKDKNRTLVKGEKYVLPMQKGEPIEGEEISQKLFNDHFANEIKIRRQERYRSFVNFVNGKIKLGKRKIIAIENDVKLANENLKFENIANSILCLNLNMKAHLDEIKIEDEIIQLDAKKTLYENVEHFFKKAKKAKETISKSETNIKNANDEISAYINLLEKFNSLSEKEADKLMSDMGINKKKKEVHATIFNQPFKINLNGTIIYFGKNASQNDFLSFVMKLDREFTWLHLKDKPGAHIVIANIKPTDAELSFAAELSVHCSHQVTGEVIYTKKKNVRRGHNLGEAILKNYQVIRINNVSERVKLMHSEAVHLK